MEHQHPASAQDLRHSDLREWQEKQIRELRDWLQQQRDADRAFQAELKNAGRAWQELQARENQEWKERHAKRLAVANWTFQAVVVFFLAIVTLVFGWLARPPQTSLQPQLAPMPAPPVIIHVDKEGNATFGKAPTLPNPSGPPVLRKT